MKRTIGLLMMGLVTWVLSGCEGKQGLTGPQGEQGSTGSKGDQGEIGSTGPQGEQGVTGASGVRGTTGIKGAAGEQGPQGDPGPSGSSVYVNEFATSNDISTWTLSGNGEMSIQNRKLRIEADEDPTWQWGPVVAEPSMYFQHTWSDFEIHVTTEYIRGDGYYGLRFFDSTGGSFNFVINHADNRVSVLESTHMIYGSDSSGLIEILRDFNHQQNIVVQPERANPGDYNNWRIKRFQRFEYQTEAIMSAIENLEEDNALEWINQWFLNHFPYANVCFQYTCSSNEPNTFNPELMYWTQTNDGKHDLHIVKEMFGSTSTVSFYIDDILIEKVDPWPLSEGENVGLVVGGYTQVNFDNLIIKVDGGDPQPIKKMIQ